MELFKEINYIQNFGSISINRDIFNNNSSWLDIVKEIELRNYNNVDVNIYSHDYLDFLGSFQENIIEDYISKKKENQFMTIENYIQRFIWWNTSVLENILFSKNSHEEYNDRITQKLELINFPKHFVSISDEIIYTIEKKGSKEYNYIFLKGFENKDESFQKDYFLNLYKFLSEELPILLKEIDIKSNPKATQKQNVQEVVDNYILNTSQNDNLAKDKLEGYTDEEIESINDYLEQFKDEGKIDDKNYDILVNALLSFINIKIFPEEKIKFKGKVDQKKLGTSIRKLLKQKGLDVDDRVLRFAKNYISIYENTTYYEGSKGKDNKLYQYFRENRY